MPLSHGIVVHGGAGRIDPSSEEDLEKRRAVLNKSATDAFSLLQSKDANAIDAVEFAINVLEDSKIFNAGYGSCLTLDGQVRMDAAIMAGDLSCGAVADHNVTPNSITLARKVMEYSDHVLLVGSDSIRTFCRSIGYEPLGPVLPSPGKMKAYRGFLTKMEEGGSTEWPRNSKIMKNYPAITQSDTVGAIAIDSSGGICAGVSTGGRWLKLPGRVGDSALVGSGLYASNASGAVSATGAGEEIIRVCLSKMVCDLMEKGVEPQMACNTAIEQLTNLRGRGTAGIIALDKLGRFGSACNTEAFTRSVRFSSMKQTRVVLYGNEDIIP